MVDAKRIVTAACAACLVLAGCQRKAPPPTRLLRAARDLRAGQTLREDDLLVVAPPPEQLAALVDAVRADELPSVVGRKVNQPLREGQWLLGVQLRQVGPLAPALQPRAGAVAFTDDGDGVASTSIMQRALQYAGMLGVPLMQHCQDPDLAGGHMNSGPVAVRLGLPGIAASGEEIMLRRDLELVEHIGSRYHVLHVSTAGSVELITCILAIRDGIIPPTINYEHPDLNCDLDYVPNTPRKADIKTVLSNSFGFGGQNDTVVIKKYDG